MAEYKVNEKVRIARDNDNDGYDKYRDKVLIVTSVATSISEHIGYDSSMEGQGLYDLKTEGGEEVPYSLYDYELERA